MLEHIKHANYIKLGRQGRYEKECFEKGVLALGYHEALDPAKAYEVYQNTNHARQVKAFHEAGDDTLWFTFANGKLYWCVGSSEIEYLNSKSPDNPSRYRSTFDGWHDHDANGSPLYMHTLNGDLTKTALYRGTICSVKGEQLAYLLRKIKGQEDSKIIQAKKRKTAILSSIVDMMRLLNAPDFELLVELVFAQSGWQRLNETGGSQKTTDFELYLPILNRYAFVQVKSQTNQKELQDYETRAQMWGDVYMYYVYHTAAKNLVSSTEKTLLIDAAILAEMVFNAGLFDWLLKKTQ